MEVAEQDSSRSARRFGNQLAGRFRLPVHWMDERLTTREARSRLVELGRPEDDDDPVAAQLILESWLRDNATVVHQ